jgi:sterol desaturase/sphingolipid hydroxylase (fatty acid hydroxylase superfamily)
MIIAATLAVFLGFAGWTLTEYILHRFVLHPRNRRVAGIAREHVAHHANPSYFAPTHLKIALAAIALAILMPLTRGLFGWLPSALFCGSYLVTYVSYEVIHRRFHTHAPRSRLGTLLRKHHLAHHFSCPQLNHGVTTRLWDRVFGTYQPVETLQIPQKFAMQWLGPEDPPRTVHPAYAGDYAIRIRRSGEGLGA